jgi:hypothetical protein
MVANFVTPMDDIAWAQTPVLLTKFERAPQKQVADGSGNRAWVR